MSIQAMDGYKAAVISARVPIYTDNGPSPSPGGGGVGVGVWVL